MSKEDFLPATCHLRQNACHSRNRRRRMYTTAVSALTVVLTLVGQSAAKEPVQLTERFAPGYQCYVRVRVDLTGTLSPPTEAGRPAAKPLAFVGDSAIEYDERVLALDKDGSVQKTARICRRTDFHRTLGGQEQQSLLRPAVRRLVVLRRNNTEVPFSPDGPLTWGEIDLVRTDVFAPALTGLLAGNPVQWGDRWAAHESAVRELTDLERIDEGKVECQLEQVAIIEGRRQARVTLTGTVRGINEDGPNRQILEGYFYFDLESNHLSYLYLKGIHSMLDKDGREAGRVEGRFVMTRQVNGNCPELSDDALRGVALEPDANNTLLLYDNPNAGVRFLYPRRWRVTAVRGAQITLDGADGNGLLLTVDRTRPGPSGEQFLAEAQNWLVKQNARLLHADRLHQVRGEPVLEAFALEAELSGQKFLMDYYVTRQPAGGATLAARLVPSDREEARREVDRLARSIVISPPAGGRK
jgi:hypothetical protein